MPTGNHTPMTSEAAAQLVSSGETVVLNGAGSFPLVFAERLAARADELEGVRFVHPMRRASRELDPDYLDVSQAAIRHISEFTFDVAVRSAVSDGRADYRPNHPHEEAGTWAARGEPFDVATGAAPPDADGRLSLGPFGGWIMPWVRHPARRRLILEVNANQPRVRGDVSVHIGEVDAWFESEEPLPQERDAPNPSPIERAIGAATCDLIPDGATLQFGAGGVPNAVADILATSGRSGLGIYSEGFFPAMVDLIEKGVVDNSRKKHHPGRSVVALSLGNQRLYDHLDGNDEVMMLPIDVVNDPREIMRNERLVSINAAMQVDLYGQCASEALGARHYSGTGGQWEFVFGSTHTAGGRSIIALPSTALGGSRSTITTTFPPGTAITVPRNDVDFVVTEYGVAALRGRTLAERAHALIAIAHPNFREELSRDARELGHVF